MNKTRYIALLLAGTMTISCNLNLFPDSSISTGASMQSLEDCGKWRNGCYASMKYLTTGGFVYTTELQTDLFHAVKNFGNFDGEFYHYHVTPSSEMPGIVWFGLYAYIANINKMIEGAEKFMNDASLTQAERKTAAKYYGEGCFMRAFLYFNLAQYFCKDYDPATASETLGVPIVTKWIPTTNKEDFPARNSLKETFEQICDDIERAEKSLPDDFKSEATKRIYLNTDILKALKARVALTMEDYKTAGTVAEELINGKRYPLVKDKTAFAEGWIHDNLSEALWQVQMKNPTDLGNSFKYFIYNNSGKEGKDNPQYVPEDKILDLYDQKRDIRYDAWFEKRRITTPVIGEVTLMIKYPGNPELNAQSASSYVNKPKVFRIAEMYLIAAEAYAMQNDTTLSSKYLNDLREARIAKWTRIEYSGPRLMEEIKKERIRELFCECFRLNDLKRWHEGFTRSLGSPSVIMQGENYAGASRKADDPMFVWPIPIGEDEANGKIIQNEGYKN